MPAAEVTDLSKKESLFEKDTGLEPAISGRRIVLARSLITESEIGWCDRSQLGIAYRDYGGGSRHVRERRHLPHPVARYKPREDPFRSVGTTLANFEFAALQQVPAVCLLSFFEQDCPSSHACVAAVSENAPIMLSVEELGAACFVIFREKKAHEWNCG
jgi:hypothetical protein